MKQLSVNDENMPKTKNIIMQDVRSKPLAYVVQIVGIFVIIFNLWIASKLAPLAQDLAILQTRVEAMYDRGVELRGDLEGHIQVSNDILNKIDEKLDEMHDDIIQIEADVRYLRNGQ